MRGRCCFDKRKRLGYEEVRYAFYALSGMYEANMAYTNACLLVLELLGTPSMYPRPESTGSQLPDGENNRTPCLGVRNEVSP